MGISTHMNIDGLVESVSFSLEMGMFEEAFFKLCGARLVISNEQWLTFRKEFPSDFIDAIFAMGTNM